MSAGRISGTAVLVDGALNVGQELGSPLDLVEDDTATEARQKPEGILSRP